LRLGAAMRRRWTPDALSPPAPIHCQLRVGTPCSPPRRSKDDSDEPEQCRDPAISRGRGTRDTTRGAVSRNCGRHAPEDLAGRRRCRHAIPVLAHRAAIGSPRSQNRYGRAAMRSPSWSSTSLPRAGRVMVAHPLLAAMKQAEQHEAALREVVRRRYRGPEPSAVLGMQLSRSARLRRGEADAVRLVEPG